MPSALLLPVLTCAAVLFVSGVAKLRAPETVDAAFSSLEVPKVLDTPFVRRLSPWVEVALGAGLVLATGRALVVVAALTLALFVAYLVLVVRALRRAEPVDCGCFGALGDSEVTTVTVWRNALLVLSALLAVVAGLQGSGLVPALLDDSRVLAWLVASALAAAVAVLVTYRAPRPASAGIVPQVDASGDYVRDAIPNAAVLNEAGELVLLSHESARAAHLLVFLSPGCGPCGRIGPLVAGWSEQLAPVVVRAVVAGQPDVVRGGLTYLEGHAWFDPFGITRAAFTAGNPSAVLLGADGLIAGGPVHGEEEVVDFVAQVADQLREAREAGDLPDSGAHAGAEVSDAR
ncbi:MAG TPA: MauE/DoxX family redox-associated membrane protein [Nocardioides sp.]|nr:MauE/DoxX family redox-associated membrane protein [Nocardioides sp.]